MSRFLPLILSCLLLGVQPVFAQQGTTQGLMPKPPTTADTNGAVPQRGLSMGDVEQLFGSPLSKQGAVGTPPISRWIYPGYVVYFEYSHVIQTVRNKK